MDYLDWEGPTESVKTLIQNGWVLSLTDSGEISDRYVGTDNRGTPVEVIECHSGTSSETLCFHRLSELAMKISLR